MNLLDEINETFKKIEQISLHKPKASLKEQARFGFNEIEKELAHLHSDSKILEIGCGIGLLLGVSANRYHSLKFEGLEPFGDGFHSFKEHNSAIRELGFTIHNVSYENYKTNKKYDFIYCINVFEHLSDWKDFIFKMTSMLSANGKLLILCPNYGFPIESHFRIPIIFNKNLTYKFFKNYIKKYEEKTEFQGLWKSLNFVRKSQVLSFLRKNKLLFTDYPEINLTMLDRAMHDPNFKKRQRFLFLLGNILKRLGLVNFMLNLKFLLPYMKIEISSNTPQINNHQQ